MYVYIEETLERELFLPYNALASCLVNQVVRLPDTTGFTLFTDSEIRHVHSSLRNVLCTPCKLHTEL